MNNYQKSKLAVASLFLTFLLIILNNYSKNGRYILDDSDALIIDTRSGKVYHFLNQTYWDINDTKKYGEQP